MSIDCINSLIAKHKGLIIYLEEKSKPFPRMFERVIRHRKLQIEKLEKQKAEYVKFKE